MTVATATLTGTDPAPAAPLHRGRAGHPHHRLFQGLPAALRLVPQPGEPEGESGSPVVQEPLHRLRQCLDACELDGLTRTEDGIERDRAVCTACGECVEACPTGAMEKLGEVWTVDALVKELVKDRAYFEKSGGGVTLSGGEPSLQPAFTLELMRALKQQGIPVALDTCGLVLVGDAGNAGSGSRHCAVRPQADRCRRT